MSHDVVKVAHETQVDRFTNVRCDGCTRPLRPVYTTAAADTAIVWDGLQAADALAVWFSGGYGMFFDDDGAVPTPVLLCESCADRLLELFPRLAPLLDRPADTQQEASE